jgi:hypothetical protein
MRISLSFMDASVGCMHVYLFSTNTSIYVCLCTSVFASCHARLPMSHACLPLSPYNASLYSPRAYVPLTCGVHSSCITTFVLYTATPHAYAQLAPFPHAHLSVLHGRLPFTLACSRGAPGTLPGLHATLSLIQDALYLTYNTAAPFSFSNYLPFGV